MKEKYTELDYPVLIGRVLAVEGYLNTQEYLSREAIAAMLGVELVGKEERDAEKCKCSDCDSSVD